MLTGNLKSCDPSAPPPFPAILGTSVLRPESSVVDNGLPSIKDIGSVTI